MFKEKNEQKMRLLAKGVKKLREDKEVVERLAHHSKWPKEQVLKFLEQNDEILFRGLSMTIADTLSDFLRRKGASVNVEPDVDNVVIVATTDTLQGKTISKYFGPVFAECVCGVNVFKDLAAAVSDSLGGRSQTLQNELRQMQSTVLAELKNRAYAMGANAVVGTDFDYMEYREGMLVLVANGTAVRTD